MQIPDPFTPAAITAGILTNIASAILLQLAQELVKLRGHKDWVEGVAFSPDGTKVLTGSADKTIRLWETDTGKELVRLLGHRDWVTSVAFSRDGTRVLTGSVDKTARLWETTTGKELTRFEDHSGSVDKVAFSPHGHLVIICDIRGRVLLRQVVGKKKGHLLGVYFAAYGVKAIHWQDTAHIVLADTGGAQFRPNLYQLKLEGESVK
jgi:WD40 repeat protein